jgi:membrane fusion protein, copper/silver efflux system
MKIRLNHACTLLTAIGLFIAGNGCDFGSGRHAGPSIQKIAAKYRCPMHPQQVTDHPSDCPSCGMKLVLVKATQPAAGSFTDHAGQKMDMGETKNVQGRMAITLPLEKEQLIGLRTAPVEWRELAETVRATATVQPDETRQATIAARFSGWVRSLKVNYTGQAVTNGQPLLTVYSAELLAAENDYHLAWLSCEKTSTSGTPEQREATKRRMEVARRRLEVWQVGDEELRALEQNGPPGDELLLRSPVAGYILTKDAFVGYTFRPGDSLYQVADLSHVWLRAFVFEHELGQIEVGQKAWVTFPHQGNRLCECAVSFIAPRIDPQTRRGEIRLELDNPKGDLRLDSWANVEIEVPLGKRLTIPASAVIDTGTRFVAFAQLEGGSLEPRELNVGLKTDDYIEVLEGVKEGERVVTRALFLVDSESQFKAAVADIGSGPGRKE